MKPRSGVTIVVAVRRAATTNTHERATTVRSSQLGVQRAKDVGRRFIIPRREQLPSLRLVEDPDHRRSDQGHYKPPEKQREQPSDQPVTHHPTADHGLILPLIMPPLPRTDTSSSATIAMPRAPRPRRILKLSFMILHNSFLPLSSASV